MKIRANASRRACVGVAASLAGLASAGAVVAQENAAPSGRDQDVETNLSEIVVTARKQGETVLNAPATVNVVSAEALESTNVTQASQLSGVVPGVVLTPGVGGLPATTFRGLGSNASNFGIESSVAIFVDGMYLGRLRDFVTPLYDVSRIEIIKGTQSTLLGKNSSLGAISISTRAPGVSASGDLSAAYSDGIGQTKFTGGATLPLSEQLSVRGAFLFSNEDGYYDNSFVGRSEQDVRDRSGRLSLSWRPADATEVLLRYQHDQRDSDGQNLEVLADGNGVVRARATQLGQANLDVVPNRISQSGNVLVGAGAVPSPLPFDDQTTDRLNLLVNHDLNGMTLTAQTGYISWESDRNSDLDFTRAALFDLRDNEQNEAFTQEVRLASEDGGRLSWLSGLFYYRGDWRLNRAITANSGGGVFPITGSYDNTLQLDTRSISAFGSLRYMLTDDVRLLGGLRYTHEEKTATYLRTGTGVLGTISSPPIPLTTLPTMSSDDVDYDFGIQYQVRPDLMLYATASKGSKSGGFLDTPTSLAVAEFEGETAYTQEIGAKWDLRADGYVTVALFNTDLKDSQTNYVVLVNGVAQGAIGNADIRSRGVEASGQFRFSPEYALTGSVVYAPARFQENFPSTAPFLALDDTPLPRAPDWSGKIQFDGRQDLGRGLHLTQQVSLNYQSDFDLVSFRTTQPTAPIAEEHVLLDARIGLESDRGWEISLIGNNLTNERYNTFATNISASPGGYYGTVNRPRVVTLQVGYKF